ncbi:MAG: hypothetical protein NT062_36050 [Proteobacteria bacterium]|nr:hypothetical protein [Pseudomonadota bacterium]
MTAPTTPPSMIAILGRSRGSIRIEMPELVRVGDRVRVRVHSLGDRAAVVVGVGVGAATVSTYNAGVPWDAPAHVDLLELVGIDRAESAPTCRAMITPTAMSTAGTPTGWTLVVSAADYARIGSPVARFTISVARADGTTEECSIFRVTERLDSARHPSVDRVELATSLPIASYRALEQVQMTDSRPPARSPTRIEMLLRGQLHD